MKGLLNYIKAEPVVWQTFVMATINLLVVVGVLHLTDVQLGGVNAFVAALLGVIVRRVVTPLANPKTNDNKPLVTK
jgi:hypothetical protein